MVSELMKLKTIKNRTSKLVSGVSMAPVRYVYIPLLGECVNAKLSEDGLKSSEGNGASFGDSSLFDRRQGHDGLQPTADYGSGNLPTDDNLLNNRLMERKQCSGEVHIQDPEMHHFINDPVERRTTSSTRMRMI
jgi:hypothetical protein